MKNLKEFKKILLILLSLLILWFVFIRKKTIAPVLPSVSETKPFESDGKLNESKKDPISTGTAATTIPISKEWQERLQKQALPVISDPSPFCVNSDQGIFHIPREMGLRITKYNANAFYISKSLTYCLKPGRFKFVISEYDEIGRINYRHYLRFTSVITEISDVRKEEINFRSWVALSNLGVDKYLKDKIVKVVLSRPSYESLYFNFDSLSDFKMASKRMEKETEISKAAAPSIHNRFFPPTHPALTALYQTLKETENEFSLINKYDVSGFNLATAYFTKFRKIPTIFRNSSELFSDLVKENLVEPNEKLFDSNRSVVIDLRPERSTPFLKIVPSVAIPINLRGAGTPWEMLGRFKSDWRFKEKVLNLYRQKLTTEKSVWSRKNLIILGTDHDDPLIQLFYSAMERPGDFKTSIIKGGVYQMALEQYFFGRKYFVETPGFELNPGWQSVLLMGR